MDEAELYVRQEAYYDAIPDGKKLSRAEQIREEVAAASREATPPDDSGDEDDGSIPDTPNVSVQELREIPMPEISEAAGYLVALLHSAGTATATGMGLVGLSWQEIESWARCNDFIRVLSPKEYRAVWRLSKAYAAEIAGASKKDAKPPYKPEVEVQDEVVREMVEEKVEDVFASMIAAQKRE